jgi:hypothetical protein
LVVPPVQKPSSYWYGGEYRISNALDSSLPPLANANADMNARKLISYGKSATAISYSNPSRPESSLLTGVLELAKDGIPHVIGSTFWRDRALTAKNAGSEYLNTEFGWKPLVKDITDFAHVVSNSSDLISAYERGSGSRQRRGFSFPRTSLQSFQTFVNANSHPAEPMIWNNSTLYKNRASYDRIWFEGAFRYYLAPTGMGRYAQLGKKLFGIGLTPDILWNLAPWTWAVDWFGNMGDVIANISYLGLDATAMEWGYMMNESVITNILTQSLLGRNVNSVVGNPNVAGKTYQFQMVETISTKSRIAASPYSFAVTPALLSAKQTAILIALGLSHKT